MCGRYTLASSPEELAEYFELAEPPVVPPRYNIAPTQHVGVVLLSPEKEQREWHTMRWGLIPSWAKDKSIAAKMINARSETAGEKPAFRTALKRRRCLIPADGFYEWRKTGKPKQPFHIRMADGGPFAMAGLWEHWNGPEGESIDSCTILTTDANERIRPLHDRMPVIIRREDQTQWLDCSDPSAAPISLLKPASNDLIKVIPVGTRVNSVVNDDAALVDPVTDDLWK